MFSKTTFCSLPWSSIQINPSGNFKICCFSGNDGNHGVGLDAEGNVMNVLTHSIEDAMNSELHKELRLAQSRNERHPVCRVCWDKELAHARQMLDSKHEANVYKGVSQASIYNSVSHRIGRTFNQLVDQPNVVNVDDAAAAMRPDGSIDAVPIFLDIRFSNLCNAKCIQCEPQYSNLWYNDWVELNGTTKFNVGKAEYNLTKQGNKYVSDMPKWHDTPEWWAQFDRIKGRLRRIYVVGGEPFLQPAHDEMLDRLISADLAKDIELEYDTNLMAINNKILERFSKFKKIHLAVSLDDIEKRYELIRFPSNWDRLNENLEKIKGLYNVSETRITMCIGTFSVYAPARVIPYFLDRGYKRFSIRLLRSPACYDLAWLPNDIKRTIINSYDSIDIPTRFKAETVGYLKNRMDQCSEEKSEMWMNSFVQRMDALDKLRGTDWKAVMPDVVELLSRYYGSRLNL
jgi:MoaA/NifB/PqqE/SkfB family radical SAM enzyme